MSIAVIIVNYGTPELTIRAVESVLRHPHAERKAEIHIVDNASPSGDAARLSKVHAEQGWGDQVTLWAEAENHGFGRGNNLVLEALAARPAPPEFVLLLNPDACLKDAALNLLVLALEQAPGAAAAGAAQCTSSGTPIAAAFRFPSLMGEVLQMANFGPLDRLLKRPRRALPPDQPAGPVDWVSGGSVMLRLSALREVGFFDPGFFLYFEEVELMHRLARAGWKTLYSPEAHVIHDAGAATGGGGLRRQQPGYLYDSWRYYFLRTQGRRRALMIALLMIPAAAFNILQLRLRGKTPTVPEAFFKAHWTRVIQPLLTGRA